MDKICLFRISSNRRTRWAKNKKLLKGLMFYLFVFSLCVCVFSLFGFYIWPCSIWLNSVFRWILNCPSWLLLKHNKDAELRVWDSWMWMGFYKFTFTFWKVQNWVSETLFNVQNITLWQSQDWNMFLISNQEFILLYHHFDWQRIPSLPLYDLSETHPGKR